MVLKVNEAFVTCIMVTDENNTPAFGKTISYRVFDETYTLKTSGSMAEIGSYGIYYVSWTPDSEGYWIFEAYYSGEDFRFYDITMYQVGKGIEDDILDNIGTPVHSTISGDIADLISRTKGLNDIHDDIANLDSDIVTHATALGTHDTDIKALLTTIQTDLDSPNQYKADVSALALEATLTEIKGSGFSASTDTLEKIAEAIAGIAGGGTPPADIWSYATRTLTDPASYKADVSALALEATLGTHDTDIKALLATVQVDLDNPNQYKANVSGLALQSTLSQVNTNLNFIRQATVMAPSAGVESDGGNTSSTFKTSLSKTTDDYYKGMQIVFIPDDPISPIEFQVRRISAYNGTTKFVTVSEPFTATPNAGDAFLVVSRFSPDISGLALEATLGTHDTDIKALINALNDPAASAVADAVWDELTSGHVGAGSFGKLLADLLTESQSHPTLAEIEAGDMAAIKTETDKIPTLLTESQSHPTLAEIEAGDMAAIKTETDKIPTLLTESQSHPTLAEIEAGDIATILADTNELQTDLVDGGRLDLLIDAIKAKTDTVVWTEIAALENKIKAAPSVDSILFKSGGAVCPASKSIWDALGDGTDDLNTIDANIDAVLADTGELQTDWADGGRLDLLIDAIKAKTDNIPASPATEAKQDTIIGYIDSEVADILADTGELQTDWVDGGRLDLLIDAILADTGELQTDWADGGRLDLLIDAIKAVTDNLPDSGALSTIDTNIDDIETDTADMQPRVPRITCRMDFWSDSQAVANITAGGEAGVVSLPDVVVAGLPTGVTIIRVVALLKIAIIKDTSASDNAVDVATGHVEVQKGGGGGYVTAIDVPDNAWSIDVSEATERGGDVMIGDNDLGPSGANKVDGNATYNFEFDDIGSDGTNLQLVDVMVGLRVYFTV